jgi:hypothetical protein
MDPTSAIVIVAGVACVCGSVWMMPKLRARDGERGPPWLRTENRETVAALVMFTLLVAGVALLAKGFLA